MISLFVFAFFGQGSIDFPLRSIDIVASRESPWVGQAMTLCGKLGLNKNVLFTEHDEDFDGTYIDTSIPTYKNSKGLTCVSGYLVREDGLTEEEAMRRGKTFTIVDSPHPSYILKAKK